MKLKAISRVALAAVLLSTFSSSSRAEDYIVNGLPCGEFCQAWLGINLRPVHEEAARKKLASPRKQAESTKSVEPRKKPKRAKSHAKTELAARSRHGGHATEPDVERDAEPVAVAPARDVGAADRGANPPESPKTPPDVAVVLPKAAPDPAGVEKNPEPSGDSASEAKTPPKPEASPSEAPAPVDSVATPAAPVAKAVDGAVAKATPQPAPTATQAAAQPAEPQPSPSVAIATPAPPQAAPQPAEPQPSPSVAIATPAPPQAAPQPAEPQPSPSTNVAAPTEPPPNPAAAATSEAEKPSLPSPSAEAAKSAAPDDADKVATASPGAPTSDELRANSDSGLILIVLAGPGVKSAADLRDKSVLIAGVSEVSTDTLAASFASAGADKVILKQGDIGELDQLMRGEVSAAVIAAVSPGAASAFHEVNGFQTLRVPVFTLPAR